MNKTSPPSISRYAVRKWIWTFCRGYIVLHYHCHSFSIQRKGHHLKNFAGICDLFLLLITQDSWMSSNYFLDFSIDMVIECTFWDSVFYTGSMDINISFLDLLQGNCKRITLWLCHDKCSNLLLLVWLLNNELQPATPFSNVSCKEQYYNYI